MPICDRIGVIVEFLTGNNIILFISLCSVGIVSGFLNTLAGGGSLLTVPLLLFLGLPPTSANATNRIPVLLQSGSASIHYIRAKSIRLKTLLPILLPMACGAIVGAITSLELPEHILQRLLLGITIFVAFSLLCEKWNDTFHLIAVRKKITTPSIPVILLLTALGFYGGFIQVGISLVLYPIIRYIFHYDYIIANIIKIYAIGIMAIVSVIIFGVIFQQHHLIMWQYGLFIGGGSAIGGYIGAKISIGAMGQRVIRYSIITAVIFSVIYLIIK